MHYIIIDVFNKNQSMFDLDEWATQKASETLFTLLS